MHGAAITHRVQIASLDLHDGAEPMPDTHPSLIAKPALSVADLHLLARFAFYTTENFSAAELDRYDALGDVLDDYLTAVVGEDWPDRHALVS